MAHLYVFDQNEQLLMILSEEEFESDEHKRQLNGSWTFTFTTESKYASVLLKSHKVAFYDREGNFRLFVISEVPTLTYHDDQIEVYSVNDYFQLANQIVEDKRLRDGTAREALSKVLDGSGYLVGEVADLGNQTISFYDVTRMEGLESIVETYGGEIDFRIELDEEKRCISKKFIDLKTRLGTDTGLRFTFDSNLEEMKRSDTSEGHFTVLYGRGKGIESGDGYSRKIKFTEVEWTTPIHPVDKPIGQSFIEDEEAIAKYGRIEGIYENSDIEDPGELLQATYEALQQVKNPILSYEVKATDLSQQAGYEHFKLTLGDSVILLDEAYQLSLESRIVSISESIREGNTEQYLTLGSVQPSLTGSMGNAQITAPSDGSETIVIEDGKFPDTLPPIPQLQVEGLFSSILVEWTYEAKSYYEYEIYASPLENFNPDSSNLIFRGKASTLLHQVKPQETWYYRARARNTHGNVTEWSSQVRATSTKIADGAEYFETAAISDALIGELRLDRGWVGKLTGDLIEAKNLVVVDGNGTRTLYIDSFGRVSLDVYELNIQSQAVMTKPQVDQAIHEAVEELDFGGRNLANLSSIKKHANTILDTSHYVKSSYFTIERKVQESNGGFMYDWGIVYQPNTPYRVRCYLTQMTDNPILNIHVHNGQNLVSLKMYLDGELITGNTDVSDILGDKEEHCFELIYTSPSAVVSSTSGVQQTYIQPNKNNSTNLYKLKVNKFKLERGTVFSDWSLAPEDYNSVIDAVNSELKQDITNSVAGLQDQNNELIERFDEAFSDNVLSAYEKVQLKDDLRTIDNQYESMKTMVNEFNESSVNGQFATLTLRHQELHAFVDPLLLDLNVASEASNATIREYLYQYQLQYNITFVALQTMIDNRLNTLTTTVNTTAQGVETAITKSNTALDGIQTIGKHFNFTDSGWVEIFATLNGVPGRFKTQITDQRLAFLDHNVEVAYMSNQKLYITQAQILNSLQLGNIEQSKTAKGGLIYQWKG